MDCGARRELRPTCYLVWENGIEDFSLLYLFLATHCFYSAAAGEKIGGLDVPEQGSRMDGPQNSKRKARCNASLEIAKEDVIRGIFRARSVL